MESHHHQLALMHLSPLSSDTWTGCCVYTRALLRSRSPAEDTKLVRLWQARVSFSADGSGGKGWLNPQAGLLVHGPVLALSEKDLEEGT